MDFDSFNKLLSEVASGQATSVDYDVIVSGVREHCGFVLTEEDGTINVENENKETWIIIKRNGSKEVVGTCADVIVLDRSNPELVKAILDGADNAPSMNLYVKGDANEK